MEKRRTLFLGKVLFYGIRWNDLGFQRQKFNEFGIYKVAFFHEFGALDKDTP